MNRFLKFLAIAAVLFVAAVALFHDRASQSEAQSANRLEIYYMYNEGESQSDWFAAAAERFRKLHPGLDIDILFAGREVLGKLRPRMIIGNPPDIVNQGSDWLELLMEDGLFEPLDDALASAAYGQDAAWADTFLPGLLDVYEYEDRHCIIPAGLFCTVFFYNVAQFEKFALQPPKTWSEFLHVCQVLKDNGIEPIAADGTETGYNVMWYSNIIGRTSNIDRIRATARGAPGTSWTDKPLLDAARMVSELHDKGYIMRGYEGSKWPSAQMLWVQGKCALLLCGTWIPKEMQNKLPDGFRMGIFRFPAIDGYADGDPYVQDISYEGYAIPANARHKATAIEFLKFVSSVEESRYLSAIDTPCGIKGAPMPGSLKGLEEYLSPPYKLVKSMSGITSDFSEWYRNVARNNWSDLFLGAIGPDKMCADVDAAQERFYERMKALDESKKE